MKNSDTQVIANTLELYYMGKSENYIARCFEENQAGARLTLIASCNGKFAGWLHLLTTSSYPFFADMKIPEINNFEVIPPLRRRGIGNALMEAVEQKAKETHGKVGIGVGLIMSYGSAQRMYARRGYIPDGKGIMYDNQPVEPGQTVQADHNLALFWVKQLLK
ncbi:GNAT family N-acetyltransferase [Paenibacillus piri]|uniref:GNAT family N-acetyltransferase n=2 Tax=Paenibacillus piri TaxID=2547395 RepID=A0A4R5KE32_9BACL|nr:GNAT family N-acetyltransferase [Paenibacillus piri]